MSDETMHELQGVEGAPDQEAGEVVYDNSQQIT
jgi:hypothetical protein